MTIKRRKSKAERLLAGHRERSPQPVDGGPRLGVSPADRRKCAVLLLAGIVLQIITMALDAWAGVYLQNWGHFVFMGGTGISLILFAGAGILLMRAMRVQDSQGRR